MSDFNVEGFSENEQPFDAEEPDATEPDEVEDEVESEDTAVEPDVEEPDEEPPASPSGRVPPIGYHAHSLTSEPEPRTLQDRLRDYANSSPSGVIIQLRRGVHTDPDSGIRFEAGEPKHVSADMAERLLNKTDHKGVELFEVVDIDDV